MKRKNLNLFILSTSITLFILFLIPTFNFLVPHLGNNIITSAHYYNGNSYKIVQVRKNLLVEPFEISLHVNENGNLYRYYISHEDYHWRESVLKHEKGNILVYRGETLVSKYDTKNSIYTHMNNPQIPFSPLDEQ